MKGRPTQATRSGPLRAVLANAPLARVVLAFSAVTVAEWGYVTSLAVDALRRDGTFAVGLVGLRLFVGAASSLATAGRTPRRPAGQVLSAMAGMRAVGLAGSAALATWARSLVPLLLLLALDAVASAQYRPAQSRLLPALARNPRELVAAGAALSTVKTLSQALGGVLGGVLLAFTVPAVVFLSGAVLFACASALTFRFRRLAPSVTAALGSRPERPMGPKSGAQVGDAFRAVARSHASGVVLVGGLRTFVRGMWMAIAIIASIRLLHAGNTGVGLLMLAAGLGSLLAAPLASTVTARSRLGSTVVAALVICGLPLAAIAGAPDFTLALALVAAWAIGMAVADVATTSLLYRLVETPLVPRVIGVIESTKLAFEGLGAFIAPVLVTAMGTRATLLVAALPLPAFALIGWKSFHRVDAKARARSELLELVQKVPWLQLVDVASLDDLLGRLVRVYVPVAGSDVVRQGERGRHFYIVAAGSAEVLVNGYAVGTLGRGESFGERALLRDVPRMATVRSSSPMQLLMLSREDFLTVATGWAAAALDPVGGVSVSEAAEWTAQERVETLSRLAVFSQLGAEALNALAARVVIDRWRAGAVVVRQGEAGERFYVLLAGRAKVIVDDQPMAELWPGDPFGEISILHSVPRTADVVATTELVTMSLHREDFLPAVSAQLLTG